MSKKLIYSTFVVLVLGFANSGWGATKIIVVTDNPANETGYEPFLKEIPGFDIIVEVENAKYQDPLDAAKQANLSAADLIIVSRQTGSGSYDAEVGFWNGLTTPIILHSGFLSRGNRWRWTPSDKAEMAVTHVAVVDASDPIFNGVTIIDDQVEIFSTPVTGLDFFAEESAGNGTKIATPAGSNLVMIARWDAGTEYYPGSGQIAGGPRMFFGMEPASVFFPVITADGKKMLENAILFMLGPFGEPGKASDPSPVNEATDVPRDVVLSWTLGIYADKHDVYFGTNFNDVNDADRTNPLGVLVSQNHVPNSYSPAEALQWAQTYYWRIDEVSAPPDYTLYKGDVWQFTVEPLAYPIAGENITATASSSNTANEGPENTINGSGLDANDLHSAENRDMWLSSMVGPQPTWIRYEFDRVYKLHQMWVWNHNTSLELALGFGLKDATVEYSTDGANWTTLGTTYDFARAPGMPDYAHNTVVDFNGVAAKYVRLTANSNWGGILTQYGLSEVRFLHIPVHATNPYPAAGAAGVAPDVVLGWSAGRGAVTHDVYFSTDEQAVIDGTAPVATVAETSYGPMSLDLSSTYYWKVNEVNEAETPTTWASNIWSFTVADFIAVDDFESYNDLDPDDPNSNRIFNAWVDGYEQPTNGSQVGYSNPPFCEQTIVHGGGQSMPLFYSNTEGAAYSEAQRTFAAAQNWTEAGAATLVLYFHGTEGNTGQLYVKVNGTKMVYDGDAGDIAKVEWKQWNIDLVLLGIDLQNVTNLAIGIDGNGASGTLYIDDIRLYRLAP